MSTNINTFIQFINDNWNRKLTIYKSADLPYYTGVPVNPNTGNGNGLVYGLPSDIFFDNATNTVYYRTSATTNPWVVFGESYTSTYSSTPGFQTGKQIGHISPSTTVDDLNNLSLSQLFDKLFFREYAPLAKQPFITYELIKNSEDVTNKWFEVGSEIELDIQITPNFGEWYVQELNDLKISDYMMGLATNPHQITVNSTSTSDNPTFTVIEGSNEINIKTNFLGINARVNNRGTELTPAQPTATFLTPERIKYIYGGYMVFIGSGTETILNVPINTLRTGGQSSIYKNEPLYFEMEQNHNTVVVYIKGNKTLDSSYKLDIVDRHNTTITNDIKFNREPELVNVELLDGSTVQYTKHIFKFINHINNKIRFRLSEI